MLELGRPVRVAEDGDGVVGPGDVTLEVSLEVVGRRPVVIVEEQHDRGPGQHHRMVLGGAPAGVFDAQPHHLQVLGDLGEHLGQLVVA